LIIALPFVLTRKVEALHLADRTCEALEAINEAEAFVERTEARWWCAELHRLRGVFLTAVGAEEAQIETSLHEAIRTAKEQKSISLKKRNAQKKPTRNAATKKQAGQEDVDSDYIFANSLPVQPPKRRAQLSHAGIHGLRPKG
jgi:hypothetical protein